MTKIIPVLRNHLKLRAQKRKERAKRSKRRKGVEGGRP
jgi:hypothetical protein